MLGPSVTLQSGMGKRENRWVLSLVLNNRIHFSDINSDDRLLRSRASLYKQHIVDFGRLQIKLFELRYVKLVITPNVEARQWMLS